MQQIHVIDSHTGGEPTRVVVAGGPELGAGTMAARRERFRQQHDAYRRAIICEPRGHDVLVGALACSSEDAACAAGAIFFNNVGYLGMCGHGTIGLTVTLGHLGRLSAGAHQLDTPVGRVAISYDGANRASFENVACSCLQHDVSVRVAGIGDVVGDIAWGGNWFFLVRQPRWSLQLSNVAQLLEVTQRVKAALAERQITGAEGAEIDHIELFGPPVDPRNHSRNFVLCPGGAYDRSPCGTGTSAKIACLASDGRLAPGEVWRQESITGSVFEGSYRLHDGKVLPRIAGQAYITAEATLVIDDADPLAWGAPP